jgi:hypothetical protein
LGLQQCCRELQTWHGTLLARRANYGDEARGAHASWTKGRLWGLVPTAGMELPGVVLTRHFGGAAGMRLVVNAHTVRGGRLLAELQVDGHPVAGYSLADCVPFEGDEEAADVVWASGTLVPAWAATVQIKFVLFDARLYTFELLE